MCGYKRRIEKAFPTTMNILSELLKDNIIEEAGYAPSKGGRRPVTYAAKASAFYIVAVAMDQLMTKIALLNFKNEPVSKVYEFDLPLTNNANAVDQLAGHIAACIRDTRIPVKKILGVGIGMPGFVDVKKGVNYSYLNAGHETVVASLFRQLPAGFHRKRLYSDCSLRATLWHGYRR